MAPTVELKIDGENYEGFAQMLREVLQELGVRFELIKYDYQGK